LGADVWHIILHPPVYELANRHCARDEIVVLLVLLAVQEIDGHANVGFGHTSASKDSAGASIRNDEHFMVPVGLNEVNDVAIFHIVMPVYHRQLFCQALVKHYTFAGATTLADPCATAFPEFVAGGSEQVRERNSKLANMVAHLPPIPRVPIGKVKSK